MNVDVATPTASKSARARVRILDATASLLTRKGYAGTRLSDVAAAAHLRAATIYYYFDSREDLIGEVMLAGSRDVRVHVTGAVDALPADTSAMDRLLCAVEAHLRHILEVSDYTSAVVRNIGQVPEHVRQSVLADQIVYGKVWQEWAREAGKDADITDERDLTSLRLLMIGGLNWTAEWFDPKRGSIEPVVASARLIAQRTFGRSSD